MQDTRTAGVTAPTKGKPSDTVLTEVERLNARLSSIYSTLHDLRARVSGATPPSAGDEGTAETAFSVGGFVGSVGQALEQAHRTLSSVLGVIDDIERVI